MAVSVLEFRGIETDVIIHHSLQSRFGQLSHLKEPLHGKFRLDHHLCTLRVAHLVVVVLDFLHETALLQVGYNLAADVEAVMTHIHAAGFGNSAVRIKDVDGGKIVFLAEHIVVDVVSRSYLQAACTEVHLDIIVHDDGHRTAYHRHNHAFPLQPAVARVVGVYADGCIAEDGLRTRRSHHNIAVGLAVDKIFQIEKLGMLVAIDHLLVGERCERGGVPVYHAYAAIDQSLAV